MKRVFYAIPVVALFATVAYSQAPAGQAQGQKIGLATSLQRGYTGFKTNFTAAAEKMPEADYSFKPGSTPEARTFAQVIAHIAQAQFGQCSGLKGVPNPMAGKQLEQELKTKAEVTKALADSFALCDEASSPTSPTRARRRWSSRAERSDTGRVDVRRARARQRDVRHRRTCTCARRTSCRRRPRTRSAGERGGVTRKLKVRS